MITLAASRIMAKVKTNDRPPLTALQTTQVVIFPVMIHSTISVPRTAHYFQLGSISPPVRQFWLVCHGYAQLGDEFLEQFQCLNDGHTLIVSPEGTNHFYRKGFGGPVGATWMTTRFREMAIHDNAHLLDSLYTHYRQALPENTLIVVLGFSQGAATVCRWIHASQPRFHHLVLWGALPPEDLDYKHLQAYLADKQLHHVLGQSDPFITPERIEQYQYIRDSNHLRFREWRFDGGHDIPETELLRLRDAL